MASEEPTIYKPAKIIKDIKEVLKRYGLGKKNRFSDEEMEFKSMEEWRTIEDAWRKKHPILYQLREFYYILYRFWNYKIAMIPKNTKWFYQRGKRGYSDCDVWGFDSYLAEIITNGCRQLAKQKHGYPQDLTEEEWDKVINQIANGFEEYSKIMDHEDGYNLTHEEFNKKLDDLFLLLRKYFVNLWD